LPIPLVPPPPSTGHHGALSPRYRVLVALVLASLLTFGALYAGFALLLADHLRLGFHLIGTEQAGFLTIVSLVPTGLVLALLASGLLALRPTGAHRPDGGVLLDPADQPTLVAFVHAIADRVGAPRPARIWLVPEVNAAVRYDPRLTNLLRGDKELLIGLGLVNALSLDELQAVLAHEFGHFGQRSMRLGTWVQTVNRVVGRLVTVHTPMDTLVRFVSGVDIRIAWVGWLTAALFWAVRRLLEGAFWVLNVPERALTREMEFQADGVAVAATGSDSIVHALKRLVVADQALHRAMTRLVSRTSLGGRADDVFEEQRRVLTALRGAGDEVPLRPDPPHPDHRVFEAEAPPPQMWSSHPPSQVREQRAKQPYVPSQLDPRDGWVVFDDPAAARAQVMAQLREQLGIDDSAEHAFDDPLLHDPRFQRLEDDYVTRHHDDFAALTAQVPSDLATALAERYGDSFQALLTVRDAARADLQTLAELATGQREMHDQTFPFRGVTHPAAELPALFSRAREAQAEAERATLAALDGLRAAAHEAARTLGPAWSTLHEHALRYLHYTEHELAEVQRVDGELDRLVDWARAQGSLDDGQMRGLLDHFDTLHVAMRKVWKRAAATQSPRRDLPHPSPPDDPGPPDPVTYDPRWLVQFVEVVNRTRLQLYGATQLATGHLRRVEDALALAHASGVAAELPAHQEAMVPRDYPVRVLDLPAQVEAAELPARPAERDDRWKLAGGYALAAVLVGGLVAARFAAASATVYAYNGSPQSLDVEVDGQRYELHPGEVHGFTIWGAGDVELVARVGDAEVARRTEPVASAGTSVWNVGSRGVLLRHTIAYSTRGDESPREPELLGPTPWIAEAPDFLFRDPPESVELASNADVVLKDLLVDVSDQGSPYDIAMTLQARMGREAMARWVGAALMLDAPSDHTSELVAVLARHDPVAVEEALDALVARHPDHVAVHRTLQDLRPGDALVQRYAARAASRGDADSHYLYGRVLSADDALAAYDRALAEEPLHRYATCARASVLADLQRYEEAAEAYGSCRRGDLLRPRARTMRLAGADASAIVSAIPGLTAEPWILSAVQATEDPGIIAPDAAFDPAFGAVLSLHRGHLERVRSWLATAPDVPSTHRVHALLGLIDERVSLDDVTDDDVGALARALRSGDTEGLPPVLVAATTGPLRTPDELAVALRGIDIGLQGYAHLAQALRGAPGHGERARQLLFIDERPPLPAAPTSRSAPSP